MPRKRSSDLGRSTSASRRKKEMRASETPEATEARRALNAAQTSASRAMETLEATQSRRTSDAAQRAAARATETPEATEARCALNAAHRAAARAMETPEATQSRRTSDAAQRAAARATETPVTTTARRAADAAQHTAARFRDRVQVENVMWKDALKYDCSIHYELIPILQLGRMNNICNSCEALKWKNESPPGMCCGNGQVKIPPLQEPPEPLRSLLLGDSPVSRHFLDNIRRYNNCFQMTSFGCSKEVTAENGGWMPTFTIQGQVYHLIGSLLPSEKSPESAFLQVYFLGEEDATQRRLDISKRGQTNQQSLRADIIRSLQALLERHNNYVIGFQTNMKWMTGAAQTSPNSLKLVITEKTSAGQHSRQYNAPVTNEVAALMAGEPHGRRDIVIKVQGEGRLQKIFDDHRSYDALQYPLIYWQGQDGYHYPFKRLNGKNVSCMDWYSYMLMIREGNFNLLQRCRRLFQQFIVDMFVKMESERLRFIRINQKQLRADDYIHLRDAVNNDGRSGENLGSMVILPSTHIGSPRHMHEYTQDAMTYVRQYGRPDLFITFTCNPSWEEITGELMPAQKSTDRVDLVARVFHMKVNKMMKLIQDHNIFGRIQCFMYTIEWQKRGLPHMHLLVWLKDKIMPNQIDSVISAEIPNKNEDPLLYDVVTKNMIHGPCGNFNRNSHCMRNGKCSKRYPRALLQDTQTGNDGYPLYRRRKTRDGGFTAILSRAQGESITIDNSWVVPYNPVLSRMFNAHINVEYCNSVKCIKYICKYINKGSDQAVFQVLNGPEKSGMHDEVTMYETGRYVSASEAAWRLLGFAIHDRHPTVLKLSVHLENGERVYWRMGDDITNLAQDRPRQTTLTAFFKLCQEDDFAQTLLYNEVPKYYTFTPEKKWKRRVRGTPVLDHPGIRAGEALGRVYTIHPINAEAFYLRLLLHTVRGPTSFQALKTVGDHTYNTYAEACKVLGLVEDDAQWISTMSDAANTKKPAQIRELFAVLLTLGADAIKDCEALWMQFRDSMTEDILHEARKEIPDSTFTDYMYNQALLKIDDKVMNIKGQSLGDLGFKIAVIRQVQNNQKPEVHRETSYDIVELVAYVEHHEPQLQPDQLYAYKRILHAVEVDRGAKNNIFFVDAPGGTGKTFLLRLLLAKVRSNNNIAVAVASSGIAATLLPGGRTAHSTFKIPINLFHYSTCNISKGSGQGDVLEQCRLLVWDECTMSHKYAIEAVDRLLQFLRNSNKVMGGLTVLFAGDFRQILPVINKGTMADELNACLKRSHLWTHVVKLSLTKNMRVQLQQDAESGTFATTLLQVGEGKISADPQTGLINIPNECGTVVKTTHELKEKIYPGVRHLLPGATETPSWRNWLCDRAILAPINDVVDDINTEMVNLLPGTSRTYKSLDTVVNEGYQRNEVLYPTEFLNSMEPPGLPPHNIILKVGTPIILLRNMDPPHLCNGTRLIVTQLLPHVIEAEILTGFSKGRRVFIPRIPLIPENIPFRFKRLQFPVRPCFAMTINKAQGQSLKFAGIHLESNCFSHGQLYVAFSRVGSGKNLTVLVTNGKTANIVYPLALQ